MFSPLGTLHLFHDFLSSHQSFSTRFRILEKLLDLNTISPILSSFEPAGCVQVTRLGFHILFLKAGFMIQVPDHKEKKLFEGSDKSNSTDNEQHGHERIDENETDEMVRT